MPSSRPGSDMFDVKLVGAAHRDFPFLGRNGKPAVMNFPDSPEGRRIARSIPIGHRSLVYLMHPIMRFWAAIEYIKWDMNIKDLLEDGRHAAMAQKAVALMEVYNPKFAKLWRCIRFLAEIDDPANAPTPDFGFKEGDIMVDIRQDEYLDMFNAIPWSWTANNDSGAKTPGP
jgi:hypothetical protein